MDGLVRPSMTVTRHIVGPEAVSLACGGSGSFPGRIAVRMVLAVFAVALNGA
jgi:hypothetical protein